MTFSSQSVWQQDSGWPVQLLPAKWDRAGFILYRVIKQRADSMLISTREFNLPHLDTCDASHRQSLCYHILLPEMLP